MTIRRIALQAATSNLTAGKSITVDANGLLIDGVIPYTSGGTDVAIVDGGTGSSTAAAARLALGMVDALDRVPIANGGTGSSTAAAARSALGVVDASDRIPTAMMPSRELSHYFHAIWAEQTIVQGTWVYSNDVNQTDTDSDLSLANTGMLVNTSHANADEMHFGSLSLNAGTYKVIVGFVKGSSSGIMEILIGTTSLGTIDAYNASTTYNNVAVLTYSPTTRVTGNLRFRVNGKNASSTSYYGQAARIEIIRTG